MVISELRDWGIEGLKDKINRIKEVGSNDCKRKRCDQSTDKHKPDIYRCGGAQRCWVRLPAGSVPARPKGSGYAFKSARCLAEALYPGLAGFNNRYARNTRNLRFKIVLKNLKSPFMYNNLLRKMILRSGINRVKVPISARR